MIALNKGLENQTPSLKDPKLRTVAKLRAGVLWRWVVVFMAGNAVQHWIAILFRLAPLLKGKVHWKTAKRAFCRSRVIIEIMILCYCGFRATNFAFTQIAYNDAALASQTKRLWVFIGIPLSLYLNKNLIWSCLLTLNISQSCVTYEHKKMSPEAAYNKTFTT